jgi:hypothetical protein
MKGIEILSPSVTILSRMKEQDQHALEALADALVG